MSRRSWTILSVVVDVVAVNAGILLAFVIRLGWPLPAFNMDAYQRVAIPLTVGQLLIFLLVDLYDPSAERSGPQLLGTVAKGILLGLVALVGISFLLRAFSFPRTVIVVAFFSQALLVWGWRRAAAGVLNVRWPERRVVVIGDPDDVRPVLERLRAVERWGYRVVAVVLGDEGVPQYEPADGSAAMSGPEGAAPADSPVITLGGYSLLASSDELPALMEKERPDQVIVATPSRHRPILEQVALSPGFSGEILVAPELYEMHLGEIDFTLLGDLPLLRLTAGAAPPWQAAVQSLSERAVAGILSVLLAPFFLLLAALVLVSSGRPVLYRQVRVGIGQRPFTLYKFRTMVPGAESDGPVLASADDPRVTRIGRWFRVSRLDEWPQLWNVARGEMSFVGPRPERPEFVRDFLAQDRLYGERFRVRPGITGLAQVSGSYGTTASVKLRFDLMYIYHRSPALDLKILLRTVKVVLVGRGAQ
ncbi:MAG: sugar transferase [Thermoleophilia bacterium]